MPDGAMGATDRASAKHGGFAAISVNYQGIWLLLTDSQPSPPTVTLALVGLDPLPTMESGR
jgi:hypothetical protein